VASVLRGLTERDRYLCSLLHHHRVLTAHQVFEVAFPTPHRARQRLVALYRAHVVDRFRPFRPMGSAPFHYVLGELGAAVAAAERGEDPEAVRFRPERVLAWSRSQRLEHLVGVNGFFTSLARTARTSDGTAVLHEWWSERRCAAAMAGLVRPDGYGVWEEAGSTVEFCLEYDRGTEPLGRLADKLAGYRDLEAASGVRRWVLLWLPSLRREREVRRALGVARVLAATAANAAGADPAAAVWLPLEGDGRRLRLAELGGLAAADHSGLVASRRGR
jgi:hypothetical protein